METPAPLATPQQQKHLRQHLGELPTASLPQFLSDCSLDGLSDFFKDNPAGDKAVGAIPVKPSIPFRAFFPKIFLRSMHCMENTHLPPGGLIVDCPGEVEPRLVESKAQQNLRSRFGLHFSEVEISDIARLQRTLLPRSFSLSLSDTEVLRSLAKFSQTELRPSGSIRSHRKIIGPFIVLLKRLSWPFIALHMKDVVASNREFNSRALVLLAQQLVEIKNLQAERPPAARPE